jgi:hypothetical protein
MNYLLALRTFVALSAACWFVSVTCNRATVPGSDPAASSRYRTSATGPELAAARVSLTR